MMAYFESFRCVLDVERSTAYHTYMDIIAEPQPRVINPPKVNDVESLLAERTTTPRIDITSQHPCAHLR